MSNRQVLVIEDDLSLRLNLAEMLRSEGWQVQEAADGKAGLAQIERDRPDLILCDILMPDCDGYEVLAQLQSQPETATIPFIFLSGKVEEEDLRQGMCQGADDYLPKPVRRADLIKTVNAQIAKFKRRALAPIENPSIEATPTSPIFPAQLQLLQLREQESQVWVNGITHDLRAPLTTIRVALELLEKSPEKQAQYLTIARQACEQSDALIEEILTLYREESNPPVLKSTAAIEASEKLITCDLDQLFASLWSTFEARARLQNFTLQWDCAPSHQYLQVSHLTLQRILTELLNNAFKYTNLNGKIHLTWKQATEQTISIVVRNQAEIPEAALPHLFTPFYRVADDHLATESCLEDSASLEAAVQVEVGSTGVNDNFENKNFENKNFEKRLPSPWQKMSSGLGLSIVKQLVTQLNGTLTVSSRLGWTEFSLDLPLGPP